MRADKSLELTANEVAQTFADAALALKYPPILAIDQAAELLQLPRATIYDWKSRGLLKGCCRKIGKHLRFFRDRLLLQLFNEGLDSNE